MELWQKARELGFKGSIAEWKTAAPRAKDDPQASGFIGEFGEWNPEARFNQNPPTSDEKAARFGGDLGAGPLTENTFGHAATLIEARNIVPVAWPDVAWTLEADYDVEYVRGLAVFLIQAFQRLPNAEELATKQLGWDQATRDVFFGRPRSDGRLLDGSQPGQPPGTVPPGPGPSTPTPFDTSHVPDLDAKLNALAERIIAKLDSFKNGGDGEAKLALEHLSRKAAEIQALGTPKHQRFDDLVAAISAAVAEGGA